MRYSYSGWDGTQEINPLDPSELLDLLADDLFQDGDLRSALERLMTRGARRPDGERLQGLRDLLEQLRSRRRDQLTHYNLDASMDDIREKLKGVVEQERQGIEKRVQDAGQSDAPQEIRDLLKQVADRKRQALDNLPPDMGGMFQQLLDYEFMDETARSNFDELVNDLRQKMLGNYFEGMKQGIQNLTPEDLAPVREMIKELNKLLSKHLSGQDTDRDFRDFMDRFGHMFPPEIEDIDDLVEYMQRQAAQMASLMKSLSDDQRSELQQMMEQLLRDDRLAWDLAQMAGLIEAITGEPLGRQFPFAGDTPLGLDEAMDLFGRLGDFDELERQFQEAMRELDAGHIDPDLAERLLGPEAAAMLEEVRRLTRTLEEAGLIRQGGRNLELTPKAIRLLGERALKEIFDELRSDRTGQHDTRLRGQGSEQLMETKQWEFGDPFLMDIGKTVSNAIFRSGPGTPVKIDVKDIEVYRTESLVSASTVIVLDMSMSMIRSGAFAEAKRVALALDTLMRSRFPRDYLELVVFSYFAVELKAGRLLQSDWSMNPRGTNIQEALHRARNLLNKRRSSSNRQIILITDGQPTMYTASDGQVVRGWSPYEWPRYSPEAMEETLKEVKRCTLDGITMNTFLMAGDPELVAFAKLMTEINKGRVFLTTPGRLGRYIFFDYLKGKSKVL
ncbi:MAG: VWA domain-containing protein [Dehalococcoidia bacterium]|nr:VWA domain-containing protein [Dehalococcoidia bacterium]